MIETKNGISVYEPGKFEDFIGYGDMSRMSEWWQRRSYWKDTAHEEQCKFHWQHRGTDEIIQCGMAAKDSGLCNYHAKLLKTVETKDLDKARKQMESAKEDYEHSKEQYAHAETKAADARKELNNHT